MPKDMRLRDGIKVVMIDLGNVLLFFSHQRMFSQMAKVLKCDVARVEEHLKDKGNLFQLEAGMVLAEVFLRDLNNSCSQSGGLDGDLDRSLRLAMSDIFSPNEAMIGLLDILKEKGMKLILVSNTSSIHFDFIKNRCPWLSVFDSLVLSYEVRAMKPDPAYYSEALRVAKEPSESCLFIDDIAENVAGAGRAGFQTHQYRNRDEFLSFLFQST